MLLTMLTSAKPPREMSATSGARREVMSRHKTGDFLSKSSREAGGEGGEGGGAHSGRSTEYLAGMWWGPVATVGAGQ